MENAELTPKQCAFLRELKVRPKRLPEVWPKWLTDLWIRDFCSTRGPTFYLTAKGQSEIDRLTAAEPPWRHEILIIVSASAETRARAAKEATLRELQRSLPDVDVSMVLAEEDLVDGDYLVMPCRGTTGPGGLRPMPPDQLVQAVDAVLARMRFLETAVLQ